MSFLGTGSERRKHIRHYKKIIVQINNRSHNVSHMLDGDASNQANETVQGKNISLGGLCFNSPAPYELNTVMGLIVRISDLDEAKKRLPMYLAVSSIPIAAEGEVVRCLELPDGAGYEIGIKFVDIYEDDYRILMKHLGE